MRRPRRPTHARLPDAAADRDIELGGALTGGAVVSADRQTAAIMSEQQAIITELRELQSAAAPGSVLCTGEFQQLEARLAVVQAELSDLLQSGRQLGSGEQLLLVRQTRTAYALLGEFTGGAAEPATSPPVALPPAAADPLGGSAIVSSAPLVGDPMASSHQPPPGQQAADNPFLQPSPAKQPPPPPPPPEANLIDF